MYISFCKKIFFVFISLFALSTFASETSLFKIASNKPWEYQGLTPNGIQELKQIRDALRTRIRLFNNEFRNLDAIHTCANVARCYGGNMFIYGPPGAAKTAILKWLFEGEEDPVFQIQLHQAMTELALIGGQTFKSAKAGHYEHNIKGSIADFKVAHIDEMDKGNAAVLAALLSLLNEREILAGSQTYKAKTETVYSTSNANLAEIFQQFMENGQRSTAPALLNRFQFKALSYNWLDIKDQKELDDRIQRKRFLKYLADMHPEVMQEEVFLKPSPINWQNLRKFANIMIQPDALFMTTFREFVGEMRVVTNRAVRESEEKNRENRYEEPFVYFPSCDYTERIREQIPEIIFISAFIDFLLSDLADDGNLERNIKKQIALSPLSLWRASLVFTTVGPGSTYLKTTDDGSVDLVFDFQIDATNARDAREALLIRNLKDEQQRFKTVYMKTIEKVKSHIKQASKYRSKKNEDNATTVDFEYLIMPQN